MGDTRVFSYYIASFTGQNPDSGLGEKVTSSNLETFARMMFGGGGWVLHSDENFEGFWSLENWYVNCIAGDSRAE